ncbi:hypothetical protein DFH09DRAFT_1083255 [Mycena vulgaris]|nr:hypothetical protein DFH09DRAFT_1083255 [Mycena vulgaris]
MTLGKSRGLTSQSNGRAMQRRLGFEPRLPPPNSVHQAYMRRLALSVARLRERDVAHPIRAERRLEHGVGDRGARCRGVRRERVGRGIGPRIQRNTHPSWCPKVHATRPSKTVSTPAESTLPASPRCGAKPGRTLHTPRGPRGRASRGSGGVTAEVDDIYFGGVGELRGVGGFSGVGGSDSEEEDTEEAARLNVAAM